MSGWSINLFRLFGIQLSVHATFFILLSYAAYEGWQSGGTRGLVWRVWLTIFFFICVVLHELGHSLTARRYGVRVPRILLLPIGGMAEFDRIPRKPSAEFLITIAGPAVNFVIAAILLPIVASHLWRGSYMAEFSLPMVCWQLFCANLIMGFFNLLPVYPMDGGRILRSILALWFSYLQATRFAVMTTRIAAPLLIAVAIYLNWWMAALLFFFILMSGNAEYRVLQRREEEEAERTEAARHTATWPPLIEEPPLLNSSTPSFPLPPER